MKRLAALYGGSFPEHRVLNNPVRRKWISDVIYLLDLPNTDLNQFGGLLIPEGCIISASSPPAIRSSASCTMAAPRSCSAISPCPGCPASIGNSALPDRRKMTSSSSTSRTTVFTSDCRSTTCSISMGLYHPPVGAETLLATADGAGALVYLDWDSTRGTLLATSLDLMVHAGTTGHPTSERFLDHFLPWVVEDLL
jgi:hypothetical protein